MAPKTLRYCLKEAREMPPKTLKRTPHPDASVAAQMIPGRPRGLPRGPRRPKTGSNTAPRRPQE
eukprot:7342095-Pyramimonas_sp.AAC.1